MRLLMFLKVWWRQLFYGYGFGLLSFLYTTNVFVVFAVGTTLSMCLAALARNLSTEMLKRRLARGKQ